MMPLLSLLSRSMSTSAFRLPSGPRGNDWSAIQTRSANGVGREAISVV